MAARLSARIERVAAARVALKRVQSWLCDSRRVDDSVEIFAEVGRVASRGADIELRLGLLAAAVLGLPQRIGLFLLARENADRLTQRVKDALAITEECAAREQAAAWVTDVLAAWRRRNEVIHSQISRAEAGDLRWVRLRPRLAGEMFTNEPVDLADLRALAAELEGLCDRFDQVVTSALIRELEYTRSALGHPPTTND